jgi:hypothetical protein
MPGSKNQALKDLHEEDLTEGDLNYGWIPHNAGFGFLDRPRGVLGQIYF